MQPPCALFFLFCATILFSGLLYPLSQSTTTSSPASALCVVLDAGHGGIDGGSQGSTGVYERDINLAITNKIETVLNKIRPFLNHDGGDIEFLEFKDGVVYVRMIGACEGCALIEDTLQDGVANILKEEVPGVLQVVNVPKE